MNTDTVLETQRNIDGMMMEISAAIWCVMLDWQHASWQWSGIKSADYLEIGVYKGKSASILAHYSNEYKNKLTIVDPEIRPEARENLGKISNGIRYIEDFSERLYHSDFHTSNIRNMAFIHIDGMHSYSAILSDIKVCEEMLSEFGIVCLDDFHTDLYPQIPAAVYKYLYSNTSDLSIFAIAFNKAYLCRNSAKNYYMKCFETSMVSSLLELGQWSTIVKTDKNVGFDAYALVPFTGDKRFGDRFTTP